MPNHSIFQELKRRTAFKVASIYVVTAWLIIQIVATTFPMFELPTWSQRLVVILILIGFPIVLILAWAKESTSEKETAAFGETELTLKNKNINWLVPVVIASFGMIGLLLWATRSTGIEKENLLPKEIREEKVAVSVFENFTGDDHLDALGYLGSEWISAGLRELNIQTVSPEMVRQNKDQIGILPNNPKKEISFAEITGAKYVITGSYFLQGDSLVLNTRLSSTETGEQIRTFPNLIRHKGQKEDLMEEARQYLLGFWILKRDNKLPKINPPKYEAYQRYLKCMPWEGDCYKAVLKIDPDFLIARANSMYTSLVFEDDSLYYANKIFLENRWDRCTEFEKNMFRHAVAMWDGKYHKAFEALDANYKSSSEDYFMLHESAFLLTSGLNQPMAALSRYEDLFKNIELFGHKIREETFRDYMYTLNRIGAYEKVTDFYAGLSNDLKKRAFSSQLIIALIYQNRITEVKNLIAEMGNRQVDHLLCAYLCNYIYPDAPVNPFEEGLRQFIDASWNPKQIEVYTFINYFSENSLVEALYVLKKWEAVENVLLELQKENWATRGWPTFVHDQHEFWVEAKLGCVYARQGNQEAARFQLEKIRQIGTKYHNNHHSVFLRGATPYLMARIHAILGEKEKAVELLRASIEQGRIFFQLNFVFDQDFVTLKGYLPFEELIRPKENLPH